MDADDLVLSAVEEDINEPLFNLSRILRKMELFLRTGCCTNLGRIGPFNMVPPIPFPPKFGKLGISVEHSKQAH